jgi:histidinol phosphatase-like PHP family hydrolase
MIELHAHTSLSGGALTPAALARWAAVAGYKILAFTDSADASNLELVLESGRRVLREYGPLLPVDCILGVELAHVPPALLAQTVARARELGAELVLAHGETLFEPVERGTNLAAIEAGVDILAHPGLITEVEARLAVEQNVALELSTNPRHGLANGRVAAMALRCGAPLVLNNDARRPEDFLSAEQRRRVGLAAGLDEEALRGLEEVSRALVDRIFRKKR